MQTIRTIYLGEGDRPMVSSLFRPLADLAIMDGHYVPSDLMHDAAWIAENVRGERAFYWAPREGGTSIGDSVDHVRYGAASVYRVDVTRTRSVWEASVVEVDA